MQISYKAYIQSGLDGGEFFRNSYLVIDTEGLIGVLDQLMDGEGSVVWLDNGVGHLGRWNHGEGSHHSVGELFTNLGDQQGSHTSTGTTTEGVSDLEALKAVTALCLTADNVENLVHKLSTLGVMTLGPVVACTSMLP